MKIFHKQGCWFHSWLHTGKVNQVQPKRGPFDPRTDEERKSLRHRYVCVNCGKEKFQEPGVPMCDMW